LNQGRTPTTLLWFAQRPRRESCRERRRPGGPAARRPQPLSSAPPCRTGPVAAQAPTRTLCPASVLRRNCRPRRRRTRLARNPRHGCSDDGAVSGQRELRGELQVCTSEVAW